MGHSIPADQKTPRDPPVAGGQSWRLERRDITQMLKILVLIPVAWLAPAKYWHGIALMFASLSARLRPRSFEKRHQWIADVVGQSELGMSAKEIEMARVAGEYEDRLAILRSCRPGGWRPALFLTGAEHVDAGLARGFGVVLWVNNCVGSRLFTKMAFHQAGYAVSHLSAPAHGFVGSEFGKRWLNRIWTRVEDRYLAERVGLQRKDSRPALETLNEKLRANEIISITVGPWARRLLEFPFFSHRLRLPTAPVALARSARAVLLPVFIARREDGRYEVSVEEPLELLEDDETAVLAAAEKLAELVRAYVAEHPGQWRGWHLKGQLG